LCQTHGLNLFQIPFCVDALIGKLWYEHLLGEILWPGFGSMSANLFDLALSHPLTSSKALHCLQVIPWTACHLLPAALKNGPRWSGSHLITKSCIDVCLPPNSLFTLFLFSPLSRALSWLQEWSNRKRNWYSG
jgi:hypothetical protein